MTFGVPSGAIISPAYKKPTYGAPSAAMPSMVGRITSAMIRSWIGGVTTGAGE